MNGKITGRVRTGTTSSEEAGRLIGRSFQERTGRFVIVLSLILLCGAADGSWLKHVPDADRALANPLSGQPDASTAGAKLFSDHCISCHGKDAMGHGKKPALRSGRVQHATDGELFWLLKNGNLARGMPSWSKLPEASRWQIIAYVKTLGMVSAPSISLPPAKNRLQGK